MGSDDTPRAPSAGERFDSWKEIASYLKRSVRTAQRWEKLEGLPVHRHRHRSLGSVYAFRGELDLWFQARRSKREAGAPRTARAQGAPAVAVIPFLDLGEEASERSLGGILTEELVGALSASPGVRVVSPSLLRPGGKRDLPALAERLGVRLAVEGSVRCHAGDVRLQARVLEAASGLTRATRNLRTPVEGFGGDVGPLAERIADEVVGLLQSHSEASAVPTRRGLEIDEACWRARRLLRDRSRSTLEEALSVAARAAEREPGHALAWAVLAEAWNVAGLHGYRDPREAFQSALRAAGRALECDPELAEGHGARGVVRLFHEWDWPAAERSLSRAIALRPDYAEARCWMSMNLAAQGRPYEAVDQVRLAQQSEPSSPIVQAYVAGGYYYAGQFEIAASRALEILQRHPDFSTAHLILGRSHTELGRWQEAEVHLRQARDASQGSADAAAALALLLARLERTREAEGELEALEEAGYYLGAGHRALLEVGRGRAGRALRHLEQACEERYPGLVLLKIDPVWSPLRSRERIESILARVGL